MKITEIHTINGTHKSQLADLIRRTGWKEKHIASQIEAVENMSSRKTGIVLFAIEDNKIVGYIIAHIHQWNLLGQIHGLVVDPSFHRKKIGTQLVSKVEEFMKSKMARGIYVDTPIDNEKGKAFYLAIGYTEDYRMTDFYDEGQDGITYLKLFKTSS